MLAAYFAALMDTGEKSMGAIILFMTAGFRMTKSIGLIKVERQEMGGYDEGHAGARQKTGGWEGKSGKRTGKERLDPFWLTPYYYIPNRKSCQTLLVMESLRNKIC